jgi:hypothetical protein
VGKFKSKQASKHPFDQKKKGKKKKKRIQSVIGPKVIQSCSSSEAYRLDSLPWQLDLLLVHLVHLAHTAYSQSADHQVQLRRRIQLMLMRRFTPHATI